MVGVPDQRFGERVVAVASLRQNDTASAADVIEFTRARVAGYKVPKVVLLVEEVRRAANGKADYKWAKQAALEEL